MEMTEHQRAKEELAQTFLQSSSLTESHKSISFVFYDESQEQQLAPLFFYLFSFFFLPPHAPPTLPETLSQSMRGPS